MSPVMTIPNRHNDLLRLTPEQLRREIVLLRETHGTQAARYQAEIQGMREDMRILYRQIKDQTAVERALVRAAKARQERQERQEYTSD